MRRLRTGTFGDHELFSIGWIKRRNKQMAMRDLLLVILILLIIGAFPAWPYSSGWGYYPVGGLGGLLILLIILRIFGFL